MMTARPWSALIGCLVLLFGGTAGAGSYFGVTFEPEMTNRATSARFYPVAEGRFQMVQPDGLVRHFAADPKRPGVVLGDPPWVGLVRGSKASVWADPDQTDGRRRTAFSFDSGLLSELFLDGQTYTFPHGYQASVKTVSELWPKTVARSFEKMSQGDLWRGGGRERLWYVNPNAAGMLMVEVALLCLVLVRFSCPYARFLGGILALLATAVLFQTGSRSGFLALILGIGIMLLPCVRNVRQLMRVRNVVGLAALGGIALAVLWLSGMLERFTVNLFSVDEGNSRRVDVALAQLRMLADAAGGWAGGSLRFRTSCLSWYLPQHDHVLWTHLSSLASRGWFGSVLYLSGWFAAMALTLRTLWRGQSAFPCAVISAYFLAGWLNPVYQDKSLWVIPALALVVAVVRDIPSVRAWIATAGTSVLLAVLCVAGLVVWGRVIGPARWPKIGVVGKCVTLNGDKPKVWVVEDKMVLGGVGVPGREAVLHYIRKPKAKPIGYAHAVDDLPDEVETLVLAGESGRDFLERLARKAAPKAQRILFLSPSFDPAEIPTSLREVADVLVLRGNLVPQGAVDGETETWVKELPGTQLYVANWMKLLTNLKDL